MHRQVKLLGIDYASGKKLMRSVQRGRLALIVQRKRRYTRLGPTAARVLINTGALLALRYGAGVVGANLEDQMKPLPDAVATGETYQTRSLAVSVT
jgi:hypothetical protein